MYNKRQTRCRNFSCFIFNNGKIYQQQIIYWMQKQRAPAYNVQVVTLDIDSPSYAYCLNNVKSQKNPGSLRHSGKVRPNAQMSVIFDRDNYISHFISSSAIASNKLNAVACEPPSFHGNEERLVAVWADFQQATVDKITPGLCEGLSWRTH